MSEKVIKEGGYQPTKDPPDRPPSKLLKPSRERAEPPPDAPSGGDGSDDGG